MYDMCYKVDSKSKVRIWYIEQQDDKYRTWDGTQGGKIKCSEWRIAFPTNLGRSNERDGSAQAAFEIEALYKKKCEKDYHTSIESAKTGGSHIFEAMLAEKYDAKNFQSGFAQPKLDGFRCIANKDGLWSRSGKPFVSSPHIMEALAPLFAEDPDLIFDGELYNHELRDNFNEIASLIGVKSDKKLTPEHYTKTRAMVQYHIYDVPSHSGNFAERDAYLESLFLDEEDPCPKCLRLVSTQAVFTADSFDQCHGEWLEAGYEGSMWRNNTKYENRRTKNLLKRKDFLDEEFEMIKTEEGQGNWAGAAKSVFFKVPGAAINFGDLFYNPGSDEMLQYSSTVVPSEGSVRVAKAGIKGSYERGVELLTETHKIVTIKFFERTPDGVPRFGVATMFHGLKREI